MLGEGLKSYLRERQVAFTEIPHRLTYTASQSAAAAHVPVEEFAKTLIVRVDASPAMAVLPASCSLDAVALRDALGARRLELMEEQELVERFPGCEPGAMPPFGHLFDMPVYVDVRLTHDDKIAFNGGSHRELIQIDYADYERVEHPRVIDFALERPAARRTHSGSWAD